MPNAVKYKTGNLTGSLQKGNVALGVSGSLGPTSTTGWYNGPNSPTSGLYQIIETAASGDPDVYCPQNDAELIKFARWKGATGADTGSAAAVLAWIGTQTNLMAANFQYENIVIDGLIINLDAGFVGSYPTINATWYDLSGNSTNGTLTNGPTFNSANSGSIVFDGIDDRVDCGTSFQTYISGSNPFTIECWVNPGNTQANYADIWGNHTEPYVGIVCQQNGTTLNQFSWGGGNGSNWTGTSLFTLNTLQWNHLVAIKTSDNYFNTYLNSVQVTNDLIPWSFKPNTSFNFQIGTGYSLGSGRYLNGKISNFRIYNRALTSSEVLQNYNAQKGRFGL